MSCERSSYTRAQGIFTSSIAVANDYASVRFNAERNALVIYSTRAAFFPNRFARGFLRAASSC